MSGPAPMLNQLHKMAMMRKRTLIGDNELYEMMRSRQVYHVQTDLQKRLSETLNSLEHDRDLALAGILSRKLIFLRQVGKRERKRKKLVNVKKEMDEILRDADLEHLSMGLDKVWESNKPDGQSHQATDKGEVDLHNVEKSGEDKFDTKKEVLNSLIDGSSKNLRRIEKGVDLYLASTNAKDRVKEKDNRESRGVRILPNQLPDIQLSSPRDEKFEVKSFGRDDHSSSPKLTYSKIAPRKTDLNGKVIANSVESEKQLETIDERIIIDISGETFKTEPTDMLMKVNGQKEAPKGGKFYAKKTIEEIRSSSLTRGKKLPSAISGGRKSQTQNEKAGAVTLPELKNHEVDNGHTTLTQGQRKNDQTQSSPHQHNFLLKPSPPYLFTKRRQGVRAATSLSSSKPTDLRASMERTVTMVYIEDSNVETPRSSFDIEAWLNFMRQKKGYSATLKDGPLERSIDGAESSDKACTSRHKVKLALRKKKLKELRPAGKTCRDRAMEWYNEFSISDSKSKRRSLKKQNSSQTQDSSAQNSNSESVQKKTELPQLKRETTGLLLQRIREDSRLLQEKVHHLCNDEYWDLWRREGNDEDV